MSIIMRLADAYPATPLRVIDQTVRECAVLFLAGGVVPRV